MGEVRRVVSNVVKMLDREQKESKRLLDTMHQLQTCLEDDSKAIIYGSLGRLLVLIRVEAAKRTMALAVVLISPDGQVTIEETHHINSDSYLERLKSQGFSVMRVDEFSSFIDSLKSAVEAGNLIPVIDFLRANRQFR